MKIDNQEKSALVESDPRQTVEQRYTPEEEQELVSRILPFPFVKVVGSSYLVYDCYSESRVDSLKTKRFPYVCLLGPDYACSFFTTFLIFAGNFYFFWSFYELYSPKRLFILPIGVILFCLLLFFYSKTAYSDPGIVAKMTEAEFSAMKQKMMADGTFNENVPVCRYCNNFREPGVRHCYDCQACIRDLDHHCPWTGKCIGENNIQSFHLFLCFVCTDLIFVILAPFVMLLL